MFQTVTQYPRHPAPQLDYGEIRLELNISNTREPLNCFVVPYFLAAGASVSAASKLCYSRET